MEQIPDESIDMILTDPPYNTTHNNWDCPVDLVRMFWQFYRIIKPRGAICVWSQMPFTYHLLAADYQAGRHYRYEWIIEKANATGFLNARRMPLKAHESIQVFYKQLTLYNPQMEQGKPYTRGQAAKSSNYGKYEHEKKRNYNGSRFPRDVIKAVWRGPSATTLHPTQKPMSVGEYMIKTYTQPGAIVLDAFGGSGSTAVAARNTGRRYIVIEKEPKYYEIAEKRMRDCEAAQA